jgi:hypothetical protein
VLKRLGVIDGLGIFVVALAVTKPWNMAADPGLGWHLRAGQWMVEHGRVIHDDPFLFFTTEGRAWVHTQWLSDVALWGLFTVGGLPLLHMIAIGLLLGTVLLVLAPLLRTQAGPFSVATTSALVLSLAAVQWMIRPLLASLLLFAIVYRVAHVWYEAARPGGLRDLWRRTASMVLLFALWPNLHAGYLVGLIALGTLAVCFLFREGWSAVERLQASLGMTIVASAGLAATLINPYGSALLVNNLGLVSDRYFMNLNLEWLSVDFHQPVFAPMLVVLLAVVVLGSIRGRVLSAFDRGLLAVFLTFALMHRRGIPFLAIAVSAPLAKLLGASPAMGAVLPVAGRWRDAVRRFARFDTAASRGEYTVAVWVLALVATLALGHLPSTGGEVSSLDVHVSPAAMAALETRLAEYAHGAARLFHTPNWGGYLTYRLWPRVRPFIDDRNELNGRQIYEDFFTLSNLGAGWEQILDKYRFDGLLLAPGMPLVAMARRLPEWTLVHEDTQAILFWRRLEATPSRS